MLLRTLLPRPALLLLFAAAPVAAPFPATQDSATQDSGAHGPERLVHVPLGALQPAQRAELLSGRYDLAARFADRIEVIATDAELRRLDARAIPYDVAVPDLVAFYASRLSATPGGSATLGADLAPPFGAGSLGGYYAYDEVVSVLDQLAAQYPELVAPRTSLGTTVEGRDVWAVVVSDSPGVDEGEPECRFDAMHHAREPQSMQSTLWFLLFLLEGYGSDPLATWLVDEREAWFVPVVNPDGYVYNEAIAPGGGGLWRKNRRDNGNGTFGIDLNRNYPFEWGYDGVGSSGFSFDETYRGPFPASEPETQAMVAFLASRDFSTALTSHSYSNLWLSPWGYDEILPANNDDYLELGALATETSGYVYGPIAETLYLANGGTVDQDHGVHGTMSWTPEIGSDADGFWPPTERIVPLAEETLLGFQRTALAAGAFGHLSERQAVDGGDGDGHFEAGETVAFDLTARNSGRLATAGTVTVTLSSTSPWAAVTDASADFGPLAPFSGASRPGAVALALDPGTPAATVVPYALDVAYDGLVQRIEDELLVGERLRFLHDDLELDLGWVAGVPGDDATTGLWERGAPIGTTSGATPANPELDATEAPGVQCFVTGNGGGGAGDDDVDDGTTTLITPRLDLSAVTAAEVRYARWYADLTTADDVFEVSISDDGGSSWTALETLAETENAWTTVTFRVADHVDSTDDVRLRFVASDLPNNSIVEAAVDELEVFVYDETPRLNVYGAPQVGTPIAFHVTGAAGDAFLTFASLGTASLPVGGVIGDLLLDPATLTTLYTGSVPADRLAQDVFTVSGGPGLPGTTVYFQSLVAGSSAWLTNRVQTTVLP